MKIFKTSLLLAFSLLLTITSCRTEDDLNIDPPQSTTLQANSVLTSQIQNVTMNDGSVDDVVYNANCFSIQLPVTVTVNSIVFTINEIGDYDDFEDLLDEFDDDDDIIEITFPITIILADYTEIEINSLDELEAYADNCSDDDDDLECLDFIYPITASVFNTNNEIIATITFVGDYDLYEFIDDIDENDLVEFEFPISILLANGTEVEINNFDELEAAIDEYGDDCDGEDCDACTSEQLISVLTACPDWYIDDLERNDEHLEDNYMGYVFNFSEDNVVTVSWDDEVVEGTWSVSGTGNDITMIIDIPDFDDINDTWNLHEIENDDDEVEVKFEIGDDDELEFKNDNCS